MIRKWAIRLIGLKYALCRLIYSTLSELVDKHRIITKVSTEGCLRFSSKGSSCWPKIIDKMVQFRCVQPSRNTSVTRSCCVRVQQNIHYTLSTNSKFIGVIEDRRTMVEWDNTSIVKIFVHPQHLNKANFFLSKGNRNRIMVKELLLTVDKNRQNQWYFVTHDTQENFRFPTITTLDLVRISLLRSRLLRKVCNLSKVDIWGVWYKTDCWCLLSWTCG